MAIQLIDYADKADGASGVTGQISSADINQIKTKANAALGFLNSLVSLFNLDGNGLPTTIKNTALPSINLAGLFSADFVVSNGLISLAGDNQLPVPPPLTDGVADDDADTFTATVPDGYVVTDVERTFDGGTTWAAIVSLPLDIGDAPFDIGQVGLRIKATSERQHSTTLFNTTAFTVSGGGGDPDADFVALDNIVADPDITINGNDLTWQHTTGQDNRFWNSNDKKIATGAPFEIRFTIDPTKSSGVVGIGAVGSGYNPERMNYVRSSNTHGTFFAIINGNVYAASPGFDFTLPPRGRIKGDGTNVTMDYSLDGGNTWLNIQTVAQHTYDTHVTGGFVYFNSIETGAILNIIQKGLVAA